MERKPFFERTWVHVTLVLLVFTCTGLTVARLGGLIIEWLGVVRFSVGYWLIWIFGLLPIYNVVLLVFATLFGKFRYFREKQKKTWRRLKRLVVRR